MQRGKASQGLWASPFIESSLILFYRKTFSETIQVKLNLNVFGKKILGLIKLAQALASGEAAGDGDPRFK